MGTNAGFIDHEKIDQALEGTENDMMKVQIRMQEHQAAMTIIRAVFDAQKEAHEATRRMLDDATRW
jgi:hypothetical protein